MKALGDYIHSKGLKFGIYSSPAPKTCAKHEGSYGHEQQDADSYAEWGVDYLKYDWCSARDVYKPGEYRDAFRKCTTLLRAPADPSFTASTVAGPSGNGPQGQVQIYGARPETSRTATRA